MLEKLHKKLKLSEHKHTARHLPRHHTSHGILIVILLIIGAILLAANHVLSVSATSQSESVTLGGMVPGSAPKSPAVIESPVSQERFKTPTITVSGSCPAGSFVQIFKNEIFAGSTQCKGEHFSLDIDLISGKNELLAKVFDNLGQFGPDSVPVTVFYDAPKKVSPTEQLLITADSLYRNVTAGQEFEFEITVLGGGQPYGFLVNWDDGTQDVLARAVSGKFSLTQTYKNGGIYNIAITVSDQTNQTAVLRAAVLVNGTSEPAAVTSTSPPPSVHVPSALAVAWPVYLVSVAFITTFWLGERFVLYKLKHESRLKKA